MDLDAKAKDILISILDWLREKNAQSMMVLFEEGDIDIPVGSNTVNKYEFSKLLKNLNITDSDEPYEPLLRLIYSSSERESVCLSNLLGALVDVQGAGNFGEKDEKKGFDSDSPKSGIEVCKKINNY
jgi:hypothetical protein